MGRSLPCKQACWYILRNTWVNLYTVFVDTRKERLRSIWHWRRNSKDIQGWPVTCCNKCIVVYDSTYPRPSHMTSIKFFVASFVTVLYFCSDKEQETDTASDKLCEKATMPQVYTTFLKFGLCKIFIYLSFLLWKNYAHHSCIYLIKNTVKTVILLLCN